MRDMEFRKVLSELRDRIHSGEVTEGMNELIQLSSTESDREHLFEIFLDLVEVALALGDREEARSFMTEVRRHLGGEFPERYEFYRAALSPVRGRTRSEKTPLDSFVAQNPDCAEYYLVRGLYYLDLEAFEHAQADLERANALRPNDVFVLSALGEVMMNLGDKARAIALNEEALGRCANLRRSLVNLAILYYGEERNEDAYRLFGCLLALEPLNWFAWTCMGDMALGERGKTFQSLLYYSAAIVSGSTVPHTYVQMARTLCFLGRPARALEVIKLLEPNLKMWPKEHQAVVRYIQIANDICMDPVKYTDEKAFRTLLRRLVTRRDEITITLVRLLVQCASIDYESAVAEIYSAHMAVFSQMAQFMRSCDKRSIYEEEIVFIGLLTQFMIRHGFTFEARAMLFLMERSPDPHLMDMHDMYVNELYRYNSMEVRTGVHLGLFHEYVFKSGDFEDICHFLTDEDVKSFNPRWREALVSFMSPPKTTDLELNLMGSVFDPLMEEIFRLTEFDIRFEQEIEFWRACQSYCLSQGNKKMPQEKAKESPEIGSKLKGEWASVFESFKRICENDPRLNESLQQSHNKLDKLGSLINRAYRAQGGESLRVFRGVAANDNKQIQCATPVGEALAGYEPMPFAIDGTAFERIWEKAVAGEVVELNSDTAEEILSSILDDRMHDFERDYTNGVVEIDRRKSGSSRSFQSRALLLWKELHGVSPIRKHPFIDELAGGKLSDDDDNPTRVSRRRKELMSFVMSWMIKSPTLGRLGHVGLEGHLSAKPWRLPKQTPVLYTMACRYQDHPHRPNVYAPLCRYVSSGLLTRVDLTEQFFNYAVYVCNEWRKTHDEKLLSIFFEDEEPFLFPKYVKGAAFEADELLSQSSGYYYNSALARDFTEFYGRHVIETPAELGQSIDEAYRDIVEDEVIPRIKDYEGFNTGHLMHPFLFQFKMWAEYKANRTYRELVVYESKLRHWNSADRFVLEWKINDVVRRYPFLSRVYLLLVKLYLKSGEEDKAMQAFHAGLDWEDKLYRGAGWCAVCDEDGCEGGIEPVMTANECEEPQMMIWPERYVFAEGEESMFHYRPYNSSYKMRRKRLTDMRSGIIYPVSYGDNGGAYEFYRLFKKFITQGHAVKGVWLKAIADNDVYSLSDFFRYILMEMKDPRYFPFRRQLGELYYQLYPRENPGALARFFCDNMQPVNALPYAALSHFMGNESDSPDPNSQGTLTIGCLLYDLGYMELAVEYLEKACGSVKSVSDGYATIYEPQPMAFLTLGCAYIELDRNAEALKVLQIGLELDPYCDRFYYNMSLAYFGLGRIDEAEDAAKKGIDLANYPVDLRMQLMRVYVKKEMYTEALPLAQYVSREDPDMFSQAIVHPEFTKFRRLAAVRKILVDLGIDTKLCDD